MKNKVQGHRQDGIAPASPQAQSEAPQKPHYRAVKSPFGKEFDRQEGQEQSTCLCLFDMVAQEPIGPVPLTCEEYQKLWLMSSGSGIIRMQIVADAIREKLAGRLTPRACWTQELEDARLQTYALQSLIYEALNHQEDGKFGSDIQCGIVELIAESNKRLANAVAAMANMVKGVAA